MAGELGRAPTDLENDILENGADYDYFQAVRMIGLLAKHNKNYSENDANKEVKLKIRPELSFTYPVSDIASIDKLNDEPGFSISTTFMGLYGVSSPLPASFTEELLDDEWEEDNAPREFVDIIHQHIYPLLYKAWVKYKFSHNAVEHGDERYWDILYSLMGIGTDDIKDAVHHPEQLLRYSGLLAQQRKSAVGLETILKDLLHPLNVEITPCVDRVVTFPVGQRMHLGEKNVTLGDNAVLGKQVHDRTGKMTVEIGPLDQAEYRALLEDESKLKFTKSVINLFMKQPLDFDILLSLAPGTVKGVTLGADRWSSLGVDSWMYSNGNTDNINLMMSL